MWRHAPALAVGVLAGAQALLAVTVAPPATAAVGVVGALVLGACPWWPPHGWRWRGRAALTLGALGVLPFALLTWTSLASPLATVLAVALLGVAVHTVRAQQVTVVPAVPASTATASSSAPITAG